MFLLSFPVICWSIVAHFLLICFSPLDVWCIWNSWSSWSRGRDLWNSESQMSWNHVLHMTAVLTPRCADARCCVAGSCRPVGGRVWAVLLHWWPARPRTSDHAQGLQLRDKPRWSQDTPYTGFFSTPVLTLGLLHCHVNFRIHFTSSIKKSFGILTGIALSLWIHLERIDIFIKLGLCIHQHYRSLFMCLKNVLEHRSFLLSFSP